jgi:hypothetical protein
VHRIVLNASLVLLQIALVNQDVGSVLLVARRQPWGQ